MGKLGYRKREPNEPPKETPSLVRRMIEFHRKALGYSTQDLASMLCLSVPEFEQMYAFGALGGDERAKGISASSSDLFRLTLSKWPRVSPAMAAGVTGKLWELGDMVAMIDAAAPKPRKRVAIEAPLAAFAKLVKFAK